MKAKLWALAALCLLLTALSCPALAVTAENKSILLTVDEETLDISVTDKRVSQTLLSGVDASATSVNASWKGFLASTLAIDVSQQTAVITERVDIHSADTVITVTAVENGVDALVDFTKYGQRVRVEIRVYDDSFTISVPADGIEEYGEYAICGLYLLPCLGATHNLEREGYMFVPEGAGAIIDFSDGKGMGNTPYAKRVYGGNIGVDKSVRSQLNRPPEMITLPVYGMTYTDTNFGYLAVIEEGAEASEILSYPGGVITEFNWTAAHFTLREEYTMQTTRTLGLRSRESMAYLRDMTVRFYLLSGEEANYAGMARRYEKALTDAGALRDAEIAYRPRLDFLGAESEKFLLWSRLVPMTTAEEMRDILKDYDQSGLTPPLVIYRGWQTGGLSLNYGSGAIGIEGQLGNTAALEQIKQEIENMGGAFLLEADAVLANPNRMYNMRVDVVRTIGQTVAEVNSGMDLYPAFYYLTPGRTDEILRDYRKNYGQTLNGLALMSLPNVLYSYYSVGGNHTRGDTAESYQNTLKALDSMTLALEKPLDLYFSQMDVYLDMPLGTTSYSFLAAEVPFLPMVVSGHVPYYAPWGNFDSNQRRQILKLIEYGAYPSYLITARDVQNLVNTNSSNVFTAKWDVMKDTVLAADAEIKAIHAKIGGASMIDHSLLTDSAVRVSYQNGVQVYVNYGDTDVEADGVVIPAMGYLVTEGGAAQ